MLDTIHLAMGFLATDELYLNADLSNVRPQQIFVQRFLLRQIILHLFLYVAEEIAHHVQHRSISGSFVDQCCNEQAIVIVLSNYDGSARRILSQYVKTTANGMLPSLLICHSGMICTTKDCDTSPFTIGDCTYLFLMVTITSLESMASGAWSWFTLSSE